MLKIISKKEYNYLQEKIAILENELLKSQNYINSLETEKKKLIRKINHQKDELRNNNFKWN